MKKIDMHMHLQQQPVFRNEKLFISHPEGMLAHMDDLGIEKAVLMSGGESYAQLGDNAANAAICEKYPSRFAWMCNLDPVEPETVYDRLLKYRAQGAIGVGELMYNRPWDDPFYGALLAAAQRLDMPVTFHMSPEEGYNYGVVDRPGLPLLEQMLQKYPNLKFLGHSQVFWIEISRDAPKDAKGRNGWGKGPVVPGGRVPELFSKYPNLYGDLSANSAGKAIMRDETFGLQFLETYADRLFFATDMLSCEQTYPLGGWLEEKVSEGSLSRETFEKIIRRNAQRVFGL